MNTIVNKDWLDHKQWTPNTLLAGVLTAVFFVLPMGTSVITGFGILAAVLWIISGKVRYLKDLIKEPWFWPAALFIFLPWFGLLYTPDLMGHGLAYAKKTHYWIYGLALACSLPLFRGRRDILIRAFMAGIAVNAVVALIQLAGWLPDRTGWYSGIGHVYSTLSTYLVIGALCASHYFRRASGSKSRLIWIGLLALFFVHLVILRGRTAYLTFLFISPLIIRNLFPKWSFGKIMLVCLLAPCLMLASPIVRDRVELSVEQLRFHLNAGEDVAWGQSYTANQDRFYMWRGAFEIYRDNPFFGVGTGGYQKMMKIRGSEDAPLIAHPHNDILYMAVHYGFFGIMAYVWLFSQILKNGWRERDTPTGFFIFASGLVIVISGLFNAQTLDAGMAFLLALTTGLQAGLKRFSEQEPNSDLVA